jgi:rhamnosyltransferase
MPAPVTPDVIAPAAPRIGAVVVSYHPQVADLARTLAALSPQVETVFIVDNGSGEDTVLELRALVAGRNAELVEFPTNRGIAAAQNAALQRAQDVGMDFLVLFDDDSLPAPDLVAQLAHAFRIQHDAGARVAAVGPQWVDARTGRRGNFYRIQRGRIVGVVPTDSAPIEVDFLIASGTLLSLQAVRAIGAMREDYFIDHVDTEWCVRAARAGWKLYGTSAARLTHALGDAGKRIWLGRWREVALHSPVRNYYEVRNTLLLMRTPGLGANWRIAQAKRLLQLLAFYAMLVPPRGARIRLMAKAMAHGLAGRGGPLQ